MESSQVTPNRLLGRTLLIANPTAQSGKGALGMRDAESFLSSNPQITDGFEVVATERPGHAAEIVSAARGFDTVLALGGDGLIHEVVGGLMLVPAAERPTMGILPLGSGNDYARTLGVVMNRPVQALRQLVEASPRSLDLGLVNGIYYMETLSFGLDAAIALDTVERRTPGGANGTLLYGASGIDVFTHNRTPFPYTATLWDADGTPQHLEGSEMVFAVQVGPSYGGGFRICPDASPTDGLLDLCRTVDVPPLPLTLGLFLLARFGKHAGSKHVGFSRLTRLVVDFAVEPPCQADGEKVTGTHFEVESVPGALKVLVPKGARF